MSIETTNRLWLLVTGVLVLVIIISSILIRLRLNNAQPIEILPRQTPNFQGEIYVGGAVSNPGIYPLKSGDSIDSLVTASGGTSADADLSQINLYIPKMGDAETPQKININRAEPWLLEALPDVGASRAQAIVEYRKTNGPFRCIEEITGVPGIGDPTFQKIRDLITVAD